MDSIVLFSEVFMCLLGFYLIWLHHVVRKLKERIEDLEWKQNNLERDFGEITLPVQIEHRKMQPPT